VVTGASAGVGRATVREFARRGACVALVARGIDGLEAAAHEVRELGGEALLVALDVSDARAVEEAASEIEVRLGPIEVWVNNAVVTELAPLLKLPAEDFRRITEATYLGTVYGTQAALRRMLPRDRGTIVQVGSALAYRGIPLQAAYCGTKFAIRGFTDSLRTELLHEGSAVQLPALNTPQLDWCRTALPNRPQPVPPIFRPEVAARSIWEAAHQRRRELWVGGPTWKAILGNRVAPWFADRVLARKGYRSQQTEQPIARGRRDNLWRPVPGDHGAHGRFDRRARDRSLHSRFRRWWDRAANRLRTGH
jgi:NAD(P)-dependent dehydrogenase (short-subunit alcohol dehydrogenase family)